MPTVKVSPSVLASDFSRLGDQIERVIAAGADWIHFDIMDGQFVPNITMGPPVLACLRQYCTVPMDVHLMIAEPERYVDDFAAAGADIITFHMEACRHPHRLLARIKDLGCQAGVVLNPGTSEDELEYLIDLVDLVLIMSVNPGFGGQSFIADMLRKIENVRAMLGENRDLEVDGGIDETTAAQVIQAGANVLVAGSYIFRHQSYLEAIETLKASGEKQ